MFQTSHNNLFLKNKFDVLVFFLFFYFIIDLAEVAHVYTMLVEQFLKGFWVSRETLSVLEIVDKLFDSIFSQEPSTFFNEIFFSFNLFLTHIKLNIL